MAPCIIKKTDGGSIYATRDLAAIFYRKETYQFVKCLYVTGQEQINNLMQTVQSAVPAAGSQIISRNADTIIIHIYINHTTVDIYFY